MTTIIMFFFKHHEMKSRTSCSCCKAWLANTVRWWMTLWTQHEHLSVATTKPQEQSCFCPFLLLPTFPPSCQSDTLTQKMCSPFPSTVLEFKCGWPISCFQCSTEQSTPQSFHAAAKHLLFSMRCWYYLFTSQVSQSERSSNTRCNRTRRSPPRERKHREKEAERKQESK